MANRLTEAEYVNWHKDTLGEDLTSDQSRRGYELNQAALFTNLNSHKLTEALSELLKELITAGLFLDLYGIPLDLTFHKKPYTSVVNKIYLLNHLWNRNWTDPPRNDWVTAEDCFSRLDDTIRTTIVCRYLDGPEYVSNKICQIAKALKLGVESKPRATDEGYYAWHVYITINFDLIIGGEVVEKPCIFEIQLTTVLQFALKELTHQFYAKSRVERAHRTSARWDFASDRFKGMYLGHTLHLVDAMIVELRGRYEDVEEASPSPPCGPLEVN